jgi:hypothetical protein
MITELTETTPPSRTTRPRWLLPVLTVVAMILAAGGAVLATNAVRHKGPAAAGGRAAPIEGEAALSNSPSAPPTNASTASQPSGTASTAPQGKDIHVGSVTVTTPTSWRPDGITSDRGRTSACLLGPSSEKDAGCDLTVVAMAGLGPNDFLSTDSYHSFLLDFSGPCGAAGTRYTTTSYGTRQVGGRSAEYRAFDVTCGGSTNHVEQWTVPTWPAVQFSTTDLHPALRGQAETIVASARFNEPDTGRRVMDHGLLVGHTPMTGSVAQIKLDRTIWVAGGANNGHEENSNHATYSYTVSTGVRVNDFATLCADTQATGSRSCSLATVLQRIDQGRAGLVTLQFDEASGMVAGIRGDYRP